MTGGGKCPATAPVKQYNVSTINVEITLNQWLDFYPGYMYVLEENLDKVRAEENKNKEAPRQGRFDPGAVIPGVQAQWIQPLVIRGNQGDCVKIKLTQQVGRWRGRQPAHPWLQHGGERHRRCRRRPRTRTRSSPRKERRV